MLSIHAETKDNNQSTSQISQKISLGKQLLEEKEYAKAIACLTDLLNISHNDKKNYSQAIYLRSTAYKKSGLDKEAKADLEIFNQYMAEEKEQQRKKNEFIQLYTLQNSCLAGNRINEGIELSLSGIYAYETLNFPKAISLFNKAIEISPIDYASYLYRGKSYFQLKKYDEALMDLINALDFSFDLQACLYRAICYQESTSKNILAAEQDFVSVMISDDEGALSPEEFSEVLNFLKHQSRFAVMETPASEKDNAQIYQVADDLFKNKHYPQAIERFSILCNREPTDPIHYVRLASVYYEAKNLDAATFHYNLAIWLASYKNFDPQEKIKLHQLRRNIYLEKKDFESAHIAQTKLLKLIQATQPNNIEDYKEDFSKVLLMASKQHVGNKIKINFIEDEPAVISSKDNNQSQREKKKIAAKKRKEKQKQIKQKIIFKAPERYKKSTIQPKQDNQTKSQDIHSTASDPGDIHSLTPNNSIITVENPETLPEILSVATPALSKEERALQQEKQRREKRKAKHQKRIAARLNHKKNAAVEERKPEPAKPSPVNETKEPPTSYGIPHFSFLNKQPFNKHSVRNYTIDVTEEKKILCALESAGSKAYLVGGVVRHRVANRYNLNLNSAIKKQDVDIVTSCSPEEIKHRLAGFKVTDSKHNTNLFHIKKPDGTSYDIFSSKHLAESIEKDAMNRDFTINCLYADKTGKVLDPTGRGLKDLFAKKIISITNAKQSFEDDPIRMFRAIRFHSILDIPLSDEIKTAIAEKKNVMGIETGKLNSWMLKLLSSHSEKHFLKLIEFNLIQRIFPDIDKYIIEDHEWIRKQLINLENENNEDLQAIYVILIISALMKMPDVYDHDYTIKKIIHDYPTFKITHGIIDLYPLGMTSWILEHPSKITPSPR